MLSSPLSVQESPHKLGLVLPGGGARGAYQAGVLARLGERMPELNPKIITGVSVGALNASFLANHRGNFAHSTAQLSELWQGLETERVVDARHSSVTQNVIRWGTQLVGGGQLNPATGRGLMNTAPLRQLMHQELGESTLDGLTENLQEGRLHALALTTTSYSTGKAVTFAQVNEDCVNCKWNRPYREGRINPITVEHVMASCALPFLFPAVQLGNHWYGDGSIRQAAPLSPAIHLGANRLLVVTTARPPLHIEDQPMPYPTTARIAGVILNALLFDSVDYDATYARRITELVRRVPDLHPHLKPADIYILRPSKDLAAIATQYENNFPRSLRYLTRGLGTLQAGASDLLATLLFEQEFTKHLTQLGQHDVDRHWQGLSRFLLAS